MQVRSPVRMLETKDADMHSGTSEETELAGGETTRAILPLIMVTVDAVLFAIFVSSTAKDSPLRTRVIILALALALDLATEFLRDFMYLKLIVVLYCYASCHSLRTAKRLGAAQTQNKLRNTHSKRFSKHAKLFGTERQIQRAIWALRNNSIPRIVRHIHHKIKFTFYNSTAGPTYRALARDCDRVLVLGSKEGAVEEALRMLQQAMKDDSALFEHERVVHCPKHLRARVIGQGIQDVTTAEHDALGKVQIRCDESRGGFVVAACATSTLEIVCHLLERVIQDCTAKRQDSTKCTENGTASVVEGLVSINPHAHLAKGTSSDEKDEHHPFPKVSSPQQLLGERSLVN